MTETYETETEAEADDGTLLGVGFADHEDRLGDEAAAVTVAAPKLVAKIFEEEGASPEDVGGDDWQIMVAKAIAFPEPEQHQQRWDAIEEALTEAGLFDHRGGWEIKGPPWCKLSLAAYALCGLPTRDRDYIIKTATTVARELLRVAAVKREYEALTTKARAVLAGQVEAAAMYHQRGMVAARLANITLGSNRHKQSLDTSKDVSTSCQMVTQPEAAKAMNVSVATVQRARRVGAGTATKTTFGVESWGSL